MTCCYQRIIAWHPVLTDHQVFLYEELSLQSGLPIITNVLRLDNKERLEQGWTNTEVDNVKREVMPSKLTLFHGIRFLFRHKDQPHLFGSVFESPVMMLLLFFATRLRITCYIISEPYSPVSYSYFGNGISWYNKLKVLLRPIIYRTYILVLGRNLNGIFTISDLAFKQYSQAGMPDVKLFPFGYFIPSNIVDKPKMILESKNEKNPLRLIFVGNLIERKGLSFLIRAVQKALIRGANLTLDVYGKGKPHKYNFDGERINYCGMIPFGKAQQYINSYDLLILPSHYDGWGVVVNEALCAGVPVLCSDQVGAKKIVTTFHSGEIFQNNNEQKLIDMLVRFSNEPFLIQKMTANCSIAEEAIQPAKGAKYILDVITSNSRELACITSPWYKRVDDKK